MLRLKETVAYKDLPYNIQSHLTAPVSRETKWGMACFIVLVLDILCMLPVLASKVEFFTFAVAILINIWMIIMNSRNMTEYLHHLLYVRFMGVSFSGMSYCQLITAQKMMFSAIGFHLTLISLSLFIYAASIFLVIRYYLVVFPDSKGKRETAAPTRMLLASCSGRRFCNKSCRFASFRVCRLFVDEYRLSAYGLFIFYDWGQIHPQILLHQSESRYHQSA
ncbi:hypothetical protein [Bacillus haynesii]|uniref:hypothetical protein n=1 Tax=Bacillus haynesii TaxID=1925021 RepID=UPI003D052348